MAYDPTTLLAAIQAHGITPDVHAHPPVLTVEEMMEVCGDIPGTHTKNLFLRDAKRNYFLVTLRHDTRVDLKSFRTILGAKGSLSFASPDTLAERLQVGSGAVSPLAALNGPAGEVRAFIEARLLAETRLNIHPLSNERTLSIAPDDLLGFMAANGHPVASFELPDADP